MFRPIWCYGGNRRDGADDFVVRYIGPAGVEIDVIYDPLGNSVACYRVNSCEFHKLINAKRYALSLI